ncbi:MAG: TraR/DksA family transcriptional regulator [Streptosporangiaceae bacterium]|jgi:DnaK suppressor protein|nr:TraR/DksA family transcriptional regulator [Streptosporangiaceae bacterium]
MVVTERASAGGLSPAEKAAVQDVLIAEHEGTMAQIAGLARDWDSIVESSMGVAIDDEHDPEGATIAFERAQVDGLLLRARGHLVDLERALERLEEGSYGVCEGCKRPIAPERLAARPAATTCIRCAAKRR